MNIWTSDDKNSLKINNDAANESRRFFQPNYKFDLNVISFHALSLSSFISLSAWNDTEFNTASFNKLPYTYSSSCHQILTRRRVVHRNPLTMSSRSFEGENVTGTMNEKMERTREREREGDTHGERNRRWIDIFVVCQKSVGIIHRNRKEEIRPRCMRISGQVLSAKRTSTRKWKYRAINSESGHDARSSQRILMWGFWNLD